MDNGPQDDAWPSQARTDTGLQRSGNEDAYAVFPDTWLVADGLGGHPGGEVAARIAVEAAAESMRARQAGASAVQVIVRAFALAQLAVSEHGGQRRGLRSMGTTLVAAYRDAPANVVHVGSVGDSRAYLLDADGLRPLVRDDNFAEELLAAGELTAEQARTHPGQFMLTRAILADQPFEGLPHVASASGPARLLLCSDGLNAEIDDAEIATLLALPDLSEAADALVAAALDAGGSDNVTVVLVDLPGE
ncbi:MAG: PP2C family protein-serine/threonine phosphatase [Actinomycetales bacterium]